MKSCKLYGLYLLLVACAILALAPRASANCATDFTCAQTTASMLVNVNCGGNCGSYSFHIPYGYTSPTFWRWESRCTPGCCGAPSDDYYLTSMQCLVARPESQGSRAETGRMINPQIFFVRGCDGRYSIISFSAAGV